MSYYVIKVRSIFALDGENPAYNIFTYQTSEVAPTQAGADELLIQFKDVMFDTGAVWQNCVNEATQVGVQEITAPTVPSVLVTDAQTYLGLTVGQYLPKFNAASLYAPRTRGDVRQGRKRIGLISEANQINGTWEATFTPFLGDLATAFEQILSASVSGTIQTFTPVVVKRVPYVTSGGGTAYRLPIAGDPYVAAIATNWTYDEDVTTQNSRKR